VTFADSEYVNTVYGVTAEQSTRSGMPAYQAGSGITSVRLAAAANYQLAPRWMAGVRFMASRLQGDAADSPITEDKSQNSASVFVAYTF
jgi:outer membrane protein